MSDFSRVNFKLAIQSYNSYINVAEWWFSLVILIYLVVRFIFEFIFLTFGVKTSASVKTF